MKKIIIASDSHGNKKIFDKIFNDLKFDYFLFLGDGIEDLGIYINDERVKAVRGNCDFFSNEKYDGYLKVEDILIFYTHGANYSVKSTLKNLYDQASKLQANLACYGHTHRFSIDKINNTTLLNCGALSRFRGGNEECAIVTINGGNFYIENLVYLLGY